MSKSSNGSGKFSINTDEMENYVIPHLNTARDKLESIHNGLAKIEVPKRTRNCASLKSGILDLLDAIQSEINQTKKSVKKAVDDANVAETNSKKAIDSLGSGKSGKSSSKKSGKSGGKSTTNNLRDSLGKGTGWYGSVVGVKNAKEKDQLAKAQEFWSANMANQQQGSGNANNTGNIGSGNVSSAGGSNNGYVASGSAAVGAFGTSGVTGATNTGATNNVTTETKPPETVSNVLKLYDDDRNPLITAKTVNGKDVFYDVKTGKELTTIGAEGTEWSNETTYLQKTKELATKNGSETDYYATVDSQNGRVVLLGKVDGEWRVIKTYDSNFEAKGTITDTKSDIDISGDASNTNSTTNSQETANNSLVGVWKIDNKKAETSTGEKYWTTYTKNGDTEGTIKQQGFYATDKSLTDYKNEENCGLNEDAAKWIYDNIPAKTTVEII